MRPPAAIAAGLLVLGPVTGCAGAPAVDTSPTSTSTLADPSPSPSEDGGARPVCETGLPGPRGFSLVETDRVPETDHLGVRESYRDEAGREVHVTSGISGEFAEGGGVEQVPLADGGTGALIASGSDWVLLWNGDPPCVQRTLGGTGFSRSAFLTLLRSLGLTA